MTRKARTDDSRYDYRIEPFGHHASGHDHGLPDGEIVRLHRELLPRSPLVLLGDRFMHRFYYRQLPRRGSIFGATAHVDGRMAGFVVATADAAGFMGDAVRRHAPSLGWVLATSILASPRRLITLFEALRLMRGQSHAVGEGAGEILSLGVLPPYTRPRFLRRSGLRIAADLLHRMVDALDRRGVAEIRAVVDADNTTAKLFYHAQGWALNSSGAEGWTVPSVEFLRRAETGATATGGSAPGEGGRETGP